MPSFPPISRRLYDELRRVPASRDRVMEYRPCAVRFAIILLAGAACATSPGVDPVASVGMSESEVRQVYDPISIDTGVVYWGGSGRRRLYWQLDEQSQTWAEIGSGPEGRVIELGPREPKQTWIRQGGDSIWVEQAPQGLGAEGRDRS